MATMIPKEIDEFKTEGERKFYRFLESVAKPDNRYTVWYLPDVDGREPDFILFCEQIGLIIFEVKDWALDQIEEADPRKFVLRMGKEKRSLKNPLQQAREYFESLLDSIRKDGRLLSRESEHFGKPKVPLDYGVVFPNINKHKFCEKGFDRVINPKRLFFWDDLHLASDICRDVSGHCFLSALMEMFPPRFHFKITGAEYHHLKQLLFPSVKIDHPQRDTCAYLDVLERINVLDDTQEAIARKCCSGHHLVIGPSGSGKTLILAHKAAFLKQYNPQIKSILFLCYNITLVNYLKRLLSEKGIGLGPSGVDVYHFFELCSRILGEAVQYEKEDEDYYQLVVDETLSKVQKENIKYDAILVDEGQDFSLEMGKVVLGLLNEATQNLTVAIDERQNIYGRSLPWMTQQFGTKLYTEEISGSYRNSAEIKDLAMKLAGAGDSHKTDIPGLCEAHGPKPEMKKLKDIEQIVSYVADTIRSFYDAKEYPLSEMAILYMKRAIGDGQKISLPSLLITGLESRGIMANWVSEDYRAKRSYDITTERVAISTVHSAKGLDYACVFLLGLDRLIAGTWSGEQIRKLVYVAISRARHRLFIPYAHKTELIADLLSHL